MKKLNKAMRLVAFNLTLALIGIDTLCAQEVPEILESDNNSITVPEQDTDLVESSQVISSIFATDANIEEFVDDNLLAQTEASPSQILPAATNSPDGLENPVDNQAMDQVTSVSQLSDVQPTDWAFEALRSLVERYGCIAGYPDGTYRGNRAMTRYEFAAGLNACLNQIERLIGSNQEVSQEDLATLQRLIDEFNTELTAIGTRVDDLEGRTAFLEEHQFSTTTRLNAEVVVGLVSVLAGENANGESIDRIPTLSYRTRLNFDTSFTGRDLLTARLQASNVTPLGGTNSGPTLTNEGRVEFDGDSGNDLGLALLRYRFPVGPRTNLYLAGTGNGFVDLDASAQLNPYFDGGAVSLFGLRNPIYNYSGGAGFGLRHLFSDNLELNLGYLTPGSNAGKPTPKNGLFDGVYAGLAQIIVSPSDKARVGLTYINSYTPSYFNPQGLDPALNPDFVPFGTSTGSNLSNSNFGRPVVVNAYGLSGTFTLSPNFAIGGWVGYANHRYIGRGDANVWNWAVTLAFPNLGKEGNLGGILVGMEPKVTNIGNALNGGREDEDTSLHLEAFYKHKLTNNIEITPGVIWLTAPNHDQNNDDIVIGVLRTVFRF